MRLEKINFRIADLKRKVARKQAAHTRAVHALQFLREEQRIFGSVAGHGSAFETRLASALEEARKLTRLRHKIDKLERGDRTIYAERMNLTTLIE